MSDGMERVVVRILRWFRSWLKDFRSGWDQDDLRAAIAKVTSHATVGGVCWLSHRELEALRAEALARSNGTTLVAPE